MIEKEPNPPIIDNTTTTGEEEVPILSGMVDIDEFPTSNTTANQASTMPMMFGKEPNPPIINNTPYQNDTHAGDY